VLCNAYLTTALWLAAAAAAAPPATDTPRSGQKPSTDPAAPAPLELGKYAAARLGNTPASGRSHFWAVDLTAGEYTVVLDAHRSDGGDAHVGVAARLFDPAAEKPDGPEVGRTNSPSGRDRDVQALKVPAAGRRVIRVENGSAMAEYQLAVVKRGESFSSPWLARRPAVTEMRLGTEVATGRLGGADLFTRDAYYALDLPEGDYRVTVAFEASDPRAANAGVKVDLLDMGGKHTAHVVSESGSKAAGRASGKLVTAGDAKVLVRVRAWAADLTATLKVEKVGE
jgi:hypothetical protein